ncbi:DNA mismatch repair protein MutS [Paenibacillus sp. J5C_2022]|uniref:endonuclease MutS2 n=1 Tax=Paenibacillus sp. J5C2022 TaxID=2977129 RepID=UPI0021CFC2D6|nr:DNA mismatch repair protein MutS [Paenibacillus sp. J5C2022]MCU6708186.1 DNA mismatch repair protein MutS [Paenibacillus sp. J5C2022]
MNTASLVKLEYNKLIEQMAGMTMSGEGRKLAENMKPSTDYQQIAAWQRETNEALQLLVSGASIPISAMEGIEPFLALLGKGRIYHETELEQLAVWLGSITQMKKYMNSKRDLAPTIASYAESMHDCPVLREELARCIRFGLLTDDASADLGYIRRQIYGVEDKIERKMQHSLGKYRSSLQEGIISKRGGRFVLAVKKSLRKNVPGAVLDESASGQTIFVEPQDVSELQTELSQWKVAEERERSTVLAMLSELASRYEQELKLNVQAMASFDFITARAKLSKYCDGKLVRLTDKPVMRLVSARHPLLGRDCVPLTAELGMHWRQLIITGPNTGGKTATLKTIGLLALMNQSGLLIPADADSELGIFRNIIADLGDGQSLEQSLSTFSSHVMVLKEMVDMADSRSLLLLDEMAAGTDPSEGIALSIAVLELLLERQSLVAATTHFNEIKTFASATEGCQNGRMAFDPDTLRPLYRLEIGEAGDSHAFAIARRFGLPEQIMKRAEWLLERKRIAAGTNEDERSDSFAKLLGQSKQLGTGEEAKRVKEKPKPKPKRNEERRKPPKKAFQKGDLVWIYPLKRSGVVYRPADERGQVIVQVMGEKLSFNHKRLNHYIGGENLYPEQYDLDIVFESKANRKARNQMRRKHVEGLQIVTPPDEHS